MRRSSLSRIDLISPSADAALPSSLLEGLHRGRNAQGTGREAKLLESIAEPRCTRNSVFNRRRKQPSNLLSLAAEIAGV